MAIATAERKNKGGGRNSCAVCNHPEREDIDQQLTALVALRKLSKHYGMNIASLSRHRSNHMSKTEFVGLKRARGGVNKNSPESALDRIEAGLEALEDVMKTAQDQKNVAQWIGAYRERLRTLEIVGKARGEFSDAPTVMVNLWQSVEWQQIRVVVFEVLNEYPELRALLAKRLLTLEGTAA